MTNTTLREEFDTLRSHTDVQFVCDKMSVKMWEVSADYMMDAIFDFIVSKVKEAEKRGESNMKQRIQYLIDDNDDYMHFIEQFKQL